MTRQSNLALDYNYYEDFRKISEELKGGASIISQLLAVRDIESIQVIEHFREELTKAKSNIRRQQLQSVIDLTERNIIAKQIAIGSLLNTNQSTSSISSQLKLFDKDGNVLSHEQVQKQNLDEQKEKKSQNVEMKEKTVEKEQTENKQQETEKNKVVDMKGNHFQTLDEIKTKAKEMILNKQKEEARDFLKGLMTTGKYINKAGRSGIKMKEKEFQNFWNSLLSIIKDEKERKAEEKVKPKLEYLENDKKTFKKVYGEKANLEEFMKESNKEEDENSKITGLSKKIIEINNDSKMDSIDKSNTINSIVRLFFSNRPYSPFNIYGWKTDILDNKKIENHVQYLISNEPAIDSYSDIIYASNFVVDTFKETKENLLNWFKKTVLGKQLLEQKEDEIIKDEKEAVKTFDNILGFLFKKENKKDDPSLFINQQIGKFVKEATEKDRIINIVSKVKKETERANISVLASDLLKKVVEYTRQNKHPMYDIYIKEQKSKVEKESKNPHGVHQMQPLHEKYNLGAGAKDKFGKIKTEDDLKKALKEAYDDGSHNKKLYAENIAKYIIFGLKNVKIDGIKNLDDIADWIKYEVMQEKTNNSDDSKKVEELTVQEIEDIYKDLILKGETSEEELQELMLKDLNNNGHNFTKDTMMLVFNDIKKEVLESDSKTEEEEKVEEKSENQKKEKNDNTSEEKKDSEREEESKGSTEGKSDNEEKKEENNEKTTSERKEDFSFVNVLNAAKSKSYNNALYNLFKKHPGKEEVIMKSLWENLPSAQGKYTKKMAKNSKEEVFNNFKKILSQVKENVK